MAETRRRPPASRRRKRRRAARLDMRKVLLVVLALVIIIVGVAYAILSAPLRSLRDGRIHSNVFLGPIDVSNLTEAEAAATEQTAKHVLSVTITALLSEATAARQYGLQSE